MVRIIQKQNQLLEPIVQTMILQQEDLVCCICLKTILYLSTLNLVAEVYTNMQLKCQSIAISLVLLYFFTLRYNYKGSVINYLVQKSTTLQKMFLSLISLLIFEIRYASLITPIICIIGYTNYVIQFNNPHRQHNMPQYQKNSLPISILIMIQWQVVLLRYEGYIEIEWGYTILGLFGSAVLLLLVIGFLTFYFLFANPRRGDYYDEYEETEWYRNHLKQTLYILFIIYSGYLSFVAIFADLYLEQNTYEYFLVFVFTLATLQMLIYLVGFHRLVILFLSYDQFKEKVSIKLKNGHFKKIQDAQKQSYIIDRNYVSKMCYLCEKEAKVMHELCENLIMCYNCFKVEVLDKKRKCLICKNCSYNYNYFYIYNPRDLVVSERIILSNYLKKGQYLSVAL